MRMLRTGAVAAMLMLLGGCVHYDVLVKLNHDGSGQVVYSITGPATGPDGEAASGQFVEEKQIKDHAKGLGEGVEYVSHRMVKGDGRTGMEATYKFNFINNLKVNMKTTNDTYMNEQERKGEEYVTFNYMGGNKPNLTVTYPERKEPRKISPRMLRRKLMPAEKEEMKNYKNLRMTLRVEFTEGENLRTNSSFVDGNVVTMHQVDFTSMASNETKFKEMYRREIRNLEDVKPLMKGMPNCKINLDKEIRVSFTPKPKEDKGEKKEGQ